MNPQTSPDHLTAAHQARWSARGKVVGLDPVVPPCPYSRAELLELAAAGSDVGYLPPELATQAARWRLGAIFPQMDSYATLPDNPVTNDVSPSGWFDYDATARLPYADLDEAELLDQLAADGRRLLSLNQYIVATQDHVASTGHYLDETVDWTRLGSRFDGRLVAALIDGPAPVEGFPELPITGSLRVAHDLQAGDRGPVAGARTTAGTRDAHLVPEPPGHRPVPPVSAAEAFYADRLDLDAEWERIVDGYVDLGFARELGMSTDEYRASLPRFAARPPQYAGRFDVPLVIEPRIPWLRVGELAGIQMSILRRGATFRRADDRPALPGQPYAAWFTMWGRRFPDPIAPDDARAQLGPDEVGAAIEELFAHEIAHPRLSGNARYFEAIGAVAELDIAGLTNPVDAHRTPMINRTRRGESQLSTNLHPTAYSTFRPLVRGDAIVHT